MLRPVRCSGRYCVTCRAVGPAMHETSHASRLTTLLSTAFLLGTLSAAVAGAESLAGRSTSGPTVLSIAGPQFALNGQAHVSARHQLLRWHGCQPNGSSSRISTDLQRFGFNWLRVWATWGAFQQDVSAVDVGGAAREPYFAKLQSLIAECDRRGMVVDVTLTRGAASRDNRWRRQSARFRRAPAGRGNARPISGSVS